MSGRDQQLSSPTRSASKAFASTPESASQARRYADEVLRGWGVAFRSDALLLVAELVANAVRHGGPRFVLSLRMQTGLLLVAVSDTDGAPPCLAEPAPTATGGRGLLIVNALAKSWGWEPSPSGKTVWAAVNTASSDGEALRQRAPAG